MNKQKQQLTSRPVHVSQTSTLRTGLLCRSAFTLVELIVVITILAILGTIAFISLQGYSKSARDSVRTSDMSKIKTSLELFQLNAGKYPEVSNLETITYSGATAWTQGTFGETTFSSVDKLDKIPKDPLTEREYVYSITNTKQEYQIAGIMEGEGISYNQPHPSPLLRGEGIATLFQTNAATKTATVKISGNYNGKMLKVPDGNKVYLLAIPSIITSSGSTVDSIISNDYLAYDGYKNLPSMYEGTSYEVLGETSIKLVNDSDYLLYDGLLSDLGSSEQSGIDARNTLIENMQLAYTGTDLENVGEISEILLIDILDTTITESLASIIVKNDLGLEVAFSVGGEGGGEDAPIETELTGKLSCESANWFWVNEDLDTMGNGFCISPRIEGNGEIKGISWNDSGTSATFYGWNSIGYMTTEGNANNLLGVTAYLSNYTCDSLNSGSTDVDEIYGDTIIGRMKWLSGLANTNNNYAELNDIDWINISLNTSSILPIPALYIADCIDGQKDLTTDMMLGSETITWNNYISTVDNDSTRTTRNKYLLGWAREVGSHLPSAYSDISVETGDNLTGDFRGEYQVACENNTLIGGDIATDNENEWIWLSAIAPHSFWGSTGHNIGYLGCGDQNGRNSGSRDENQSARFVVRP